MRLSLNDFTFDAFLLESWAVEPYHVESVNDGDKAVSLWNSYSGDSWKPDASLAVFCMDEAGDPTIYFSSSHLNPVIAGFYVLAAAATESSSVIYSHIKYDDVNWPNLFLFKTEDKWMIGPVPGGEDCASFIIDDAVTPGEIKSTDWRFLNNDPTSKDRGTWVVDYSTVVVTKHFAHEVDMQIDNIYEALRETRAIKSVPEHQQYLSLRNYLPMPTMGLGTGGLFGGSETYETLTKALKLGYRLFDLAREYDNEQALAQVIASGREDEEIPPRDELFIETKVWPTDLGFQATTNAILKSLEELNSNYIDLYLLHWPV